MSRATGHRRATTITTADLTSYVIERQAEGISNANVNRELSVIRRGFTLAMKAGLLFHKPYFPMLREDNARQGFFELERYLYHWGTGRVAPRKTLRSRL